ncbi:MAG: peptidylprolyl isomerase, partial [Firmicutes bacterium]|nr:peptidylprolyl isomerase [Bacillota bacterium]
MGITTIRRISQQMAKGVVIVIVVAMAAGLFFVGPKFGESSPDFQYHGPAVRVNGIKLKDEDYRRQIENVSRESMQMSMMGFEVTQEQIREEALQRAIRDLVVQSEIKRNKIQVPAADVNRYFNRLAKQYFPTKAEKEDFYARNEIKGDREFKEEIRRYLEQLYLYLKLAEAKKIPVKVSEDEIREAYASVKIGHILIGTKKGEKGALSEAEAQKKAEEVYAKLEAGGDWDKLAKEYSTDTATKEKGGDLGELKIRNFKTQYESLYGRDFVEAALALKEGEFSKPVKSGDGYHVIKMLARTEAEGPEFEKEKKIVKAELVTNKFFDDNEAYRKWITARVDEAEVEILDPALRAYQLKVKAQGEKDEAKAKETWAQAAKFYERAVKMRQHRWDREVFLSAMEVFIHERSYDKAIKAGREILKRFKDDLDLSLALGKALYLRGKGKDKTEGLAMLKKARTLAWDDSRSLPRVEKVYRDLKLTKEAEAVAKRTKKLIEEEIAEQERLQKEMEEQQKQQQQQQQQQEQAESAKEGTGTTETQKATE